MTMLDDRPATDPAPTDPPTTRRRSSSPTASWRFSARLARREVRRCPGRTVLVMLLIALPVVAMATAIMVARTNRASQADGFSRQFGTVDLVVSSGGPRGETTRDEVISSDIADLPPGTTTTDFVELYSNVTADIDGELTTTFAKIVDVDLTDPITADVVLVDEGAAPNNANEALLSADVAERFGVDVGDSLRLVRPGLDLTVAGIGRDATSFGNSLMVIAGLDRSTVRPGWSTSRMLIDLPATTGAEQQRSLVAELQRTGLSVRSATDSDFFGENEVSRDALAWGWVAGVVAFIAVGIIIAAAFATSARRQLVTIGQLSANGASERLVRRTMGLQGMWTGMFGAVLGVGVAIVGVLIAFRVGLFETLVDHEVDALKTASLDLVVIAITAVIAASVAALVPARSAARIPVLSALAGRRPVATPPTWMAPAGVALSAGGLFLLAGAASTGGGGNFEAMLAVIGSLGVLFGMVCASPLIVSAIGRVGSRGGGVVRLASRSLDRARSAAVLTAVATVVALAVAGATTAGTASNLDADRTYRPDLSRVQLSFMNELASSEAQTAAFESDDGILDLPPTVPTELPADIRQGIERVLPEATWTPVTQVIDDPLPHQIDTGDPIGDVDPDASTLGGVVVADAVARERLDLSDDEQGVLDESGVLALTPWIGPSAVINTPSGPVDVDLRPSLDLLRFDRAPLTEEENRRAQKIDLSGAESRFGEIFVSPEFVKANELATGVFWYVIENPTDLTSVSVAVARP